MATQTLSSRDPPGRSSTISNVSERKRKKCSNENKNNTDTDDYSRRKENLLNRFENMFDRENGDQEKLTFDQVFGNLIARSMSKIPEGDEKDELNIDIQKLILNVKKHVTV